MEWLSILWWKSAQRYEFLLDLETDEEDELFENGGVDLRVIVAKNEEFKGLVNTIADVILESDVTEVEEALNAMEEQ